jgi:hypothetical protein
MEMTTTPANKYALVGGGGRNRRKFRDSRITHKIPLRIEAFFSFSARLTHENQTKNKIRSAKTVSPAMIHAIMGLN